MRFAIRRADSSSFPLMNTLTLDQRLVQRLGYAGLIPFIAFCVACWLASPDWFPLFIKNQLAYGILILSFLGGIHWGAAILTPGLSAQQARRALIWSIVPALAGWGATMIGGFGFAVLLIGFIVAYRVDRNLYAWYGMPAWLIELRFRLTCVVVAALALTVVAANVRG
jgi:hypothetical protein